MKKFISTLIAAVLMLSTLPAFADTSVSQNVEDVLIKVKQKIDIPEALTEFESNVYTQSDNTSYEFLWRDTDYKNSVAVTSDEDGRIINLYTHTEDYPTSKISGFSQDEVIEFSNAYLQKILPEMFFDKTDILVADKTSYNVFSDLNFSVTFVREKDGIKVKDNTVSVSGYIGKDKITVNSVNARLDFDTKFSSSTDSIADYTEKYKVAFPIEMVYYDELSEKDENAPKLIYRFKDFEAGYIAAATGEIVTEDKEFDEVFANSKQEAAMDSAGGANRNMLSEAEIKEIEKVAKLISIEEVKKSLKAIPYLNFDSSLELTSSRLTSDENEYFYNLHYESKDRYFTAKVNAQTGKIMNISNYTYGEKSKELSQTQIQEAEKKIHAFVNAVAKEELKASLAQDFTSTNNYVHKVYDRIVNDVKYVGEGISVTFDAINGVVQSYRLNFSDKLFVSPSDAMSDTDAYNKILEIAPIEKLYVKSNSEYVLCYTANNSNVRIDAFTGKLTYKESNNRNFEYADIGGHWAEEAITNLSQIQLGLKGENFYPDNKITQEDLFRLFYSGMRSNYYLDADTDNLYERLISTKIITEEEKAPEAQVTRENAFVYMIRLAELERVAKLADIYKVNFADSDKLSEGKLGYAAILSGMGVVCGDGGTLRPTDTITRAEAAAMLYKYLLTF